MSLSASVTKVREFNVPGVDRVFHISLHQSERLWISDGGGNIVQTDLHGNVIQKIKTSGTCIWEGYHTVTEDRDLIFTDKGNKVVIRITQNNKITDFIKTGYWSPLSIHSSHINEDLLVGDEEGWRRAKSPENINGDICTSDFDKEAVVVVYKSGQHRFSYTGRGSGFRPFGICTDVLGHILVCDHYTNTVHLLDQDSQFLSYYSHDNKGILPRSVCVDDENNLYVGQGNTNKLTVHMYLK
ncbi:uncharacterized protein LOC134245680 [Saccostrea cucullata]|uniref:uncharacterized protein LOC134245680 n=1 Tax=Saccostrea cuccullata TaxID=36930 RepID=UPI002ED44ABD